MEGPHDRVAVKMENIAHSVCSLAPRTLLQTGPVHSSSTDAVASFLPTRRTIE